MKYFFGSGIFSTYYFVWSINVYKQSSQFVTLEPNMNGTPAITCSLGVPPLLEYMRSKTQSIPKPIEHNIIAVTSETLL